jgi:hypothetical protein
MIDLSVYSFEKLREDGEFTVSRGSRAGDGASILLLEAASEHLIEVFARPEHPLTLIPSCRNMLGTHKKPGGCNVAPARCLADANWNYLELVRFHCEAGRTAGSHRTRDTREGDRVSAGRRTEREQNRCQGLGRTVPVKAFRET